MPSYYESKRSLSPEEVILSVFSYKKLQKILEGELVRFCTDLGCPDRKTAIKIIAKLVRENSLKKIKIRGGTYYELNKDQNQS